VLFLFAGGSENQVPRAVIADELGPIENYRLRSFEPGALGPQDVRIAVRAAGVSFVDVLVAAGRYQAKPPVPFTPGSECAGLVEAVGTDVDGILVGQKVIASGWAGIFADIVTLPSRAVWPMPQGFSFEEASVFAVSYATAWHALVDRGQLNPKETLLVLGAGGATGYAAVQIGAYLGARVIASASREAKRAMALAGGAHVAVDARSPDWRNAVITANAGRPVDVVFDPVGGTTTETAFRTLACGGRHLVVGFSAGIGSLPTNLALLKSASLVGVNLSQLSAVQPDRARANHAKVLALASDACLRPVVAATYPLEQFAEAMMEAAKGEMAGRIVLIPN
jgi:NADPH2:quinone reductase